MNSQTKIGIFDSGLGGLTVFKAVKAHFPNENFIYLGDLAYLPYGSKSAMTIIDRCKKIVKFLMEKNVKGIIVACNSASSVALQTLQSLYDIPIIGVINPSILLALEATKTKSIGLIGTHTTVSSKSYEKALLSYTKDNSFTITSIACPLFVPLVEDGWLLKNRGVICEIASEYFKLLISKSGKNQIDTIILGCTHYPIILNEIKEALSNLGYRYLRYIDNANAIIPEIHKSFNLNSIQDSENSSTNQPQINKTNDFPLITSEDEFYATDQPKHFLQIANNMLKVNRLWSDYNLQTYPEIISL